MFDWCVFILLAAIRFNDFACDNFKDFCWDAGENFHCYK